MSGEADSRVSLQEWRVVFVLMDGRGSRKSTDKFCFGSAAMSIAACISFFTLAERP
jgi:hypothetical protein